MTALLLDEMYPPAAAGLLRDTYGRDAVHVAEVGLRATSDIEIAHWVRAEQRAIVTESIADFATEPDLVVVVVLQRRLPRGQPMASALAEVLDGWIGANPQPYVGHHWPR